MSPGAPVYAPPPSHPQAVTVLVLGIVGLAVCQVLGVPAWIIGTRVVREIDASQGALGGRGLAQAGRVCGIIATVWVALAVLAVLGVMGFGAVLASTSVG